MSKVWSVGLLTVDAEQVKKAKENGINRKAVYERVDIFGWSIDKAVSTPVKHRKPTAYTQQDIVEALSNGIHYKTFMSRLNIYKWSIERAKTQPIKNSCKATERSL